MIVEVTGRYTVIVMAFRGFSLHASVGKPAPRESSNQCGQHVDAECTSQCEHTTRPSNALHIDILERRLLHTIAQHNDRRPEAARQIHC